MKKSIIFKVGKRALLWAIVAIAIPFIIILAILALIINKLMYYKKMIRRTVSVASGVVIFAILTLFDVSLITSIFWGIAIIYLLLVCSIEHLGTKNEIIGIATGAVFLVGGIIGIIFFNFLSFFVGLIIYGVVIILLTLLKDFMNDDRGQPEDSYEYPYD
jgi:hypothetical protein